jgi:tetratricopeptide (TPR) repeat protein
MSIITPLFCACLLLSSCGAPPSLDSITIKDEPQGLSEQTQKAIVMAQNNLEAKPESPDLSFRLAHLYLQAVRENADTDFYKRVEALMERVEEVDPSNPEVPFLRGSVALGRHQFADVIPYGKKLTASHPNTARYFGLLADAQVEMGLYDDAEQTLQLMADINPDYSALTRIAYLREIHGDREGAIEAMETAANQGTSIVENVAWTLAELGRLHLSSDLDSAAFSYDQALAIYPEYASAMTGKARVLMAQGKIAEAKEEANKATKLLPLPEYFTLLADIADAEGNLTQQDTYLALVEAGYNSIAAAGTNVDLERARFLLDHDRNLQVALDLAQKSYDERNTIYTADTLAWALYKAGKFEEADEYSVQALRTGTDDPMIHFHAGLLAKMRGDPVRAKEHLTKVVNDHPSFSFVFGPQAKQALSEIK